MNRVIWITLALAAAVAWAYSAANPDFGCITDEECALHCPPPSDDEECDGGPQPARYPSIIGVRG